MYCKKNQRLAVKIVDNPTHFAYKAEFMPEW